MEETKYNCLKRLACLQWIFIGVLIFIQLKLSSLSNLDVPNSMVRKLKITEVHAVSYNAYLKKFGKHYEKEELLKRFQIFKQSLKEISHLNRLQGANYSLTKFSDISKEELIHGSNGFGFVGDCLKRNETCVPWTTNSSINFYDWPIPERFDWREHNKVGPVLDQKKCNGCWAFSVVGAMESRAAIKNGYYGPRLSVQELIDCTYDTAGCSFGHAGKALDFLCSYKWGIIPEDNYPLKLFKQECKIDKFEQPPPGLRLQNYWYLCSKEHEEEDLLRLVKYHGPVIVVVNAASWLNYIDGVIQRECGRGKGSLAHVVQIVGFDRNPEDGVTPPHYIVRNSWGEDFGDGGYVKLAIGGNVCGVAEEVSLVDVYY